MEKTLYDLLGVKRKNSTLKSVFVTNKIFEDCLVLEVEAYDDTGFNALETSVTKFDKFTEYLDKVILDNFEKINNQSDMVRVCVYGIYRCEYILTKSGNRF